MPGIHDLLESIESIMSSGRSIQRRETNNIGDVIWLRGKFFN